MRRKNLKIETFVRRTHLNAPAEEVFRWHARPGAFERLTPPWETVEIVEGVGGIENGARMVLRLRLGPLTQYWVTDHRDYQEGCQFTDVQISGPFAHWVHTHRFIPDGSSACDVEDHVEYALPLGALGRLGGGAFTQRKLDRMFTYRHRITNDDLAAHARYKGAPMRILISGATGLVGSALVSFLTTGGHQVTRLVRSQPRPEREEIWWSPEQGIQDLASIEGLDAVVHLAGENIATGRWTTEKKARIRDSRVTGTRTLCEALARLSRPPKVLISASAIGYYGNRGEEILTEESAAGQGFLSDVCTAWEAATLSAQQYGVRVVHARLGVVLTPREGALAKMLLPFKLGLGGRIGAGEQYMSWITLDDVVDAIHHALITGTLQGPINVVAPHPLTNSEFTAILGQVLGRPTLLPLPAGVARLALGDMADGLLLTSARVEPKRLRETQFSFRHPELAGALRHMLGKV
jgi:uncharacterized protein (TIGR01777 family)